MTRSEPLTINTDLHRSSLGLIPMHLVGAPSAVALPDSGEGDFIRSLMLPRVLKRIYSSNYSEVASLVVLVHAPIT